MILLFRQITIQQVTLGAYLLAALLLDGRILLPRPFGCRILVIFWLVHFELVAFHRFQGHSKTDFLSGIQQHALDLLLVLWNPLERGLDKLASGIADLRRELVNLGWDGGG